MLSGTSRISFKTVPQFRKRSSSLVSSEAPAASVRIGATANRMLHRQGNNFRMMDSLRCFSCSDQILQPGCHIGAFLEVSRKWLKTEKLKVAERKLTREG